MTQTQKDKSKAQLESTIELWIDLLEDKTAAEVGTAVKKYIQTDTKGFPPTIGQINNLIVPLKPLEDWEIKWLQEVHGADFPRLFQNVGLKELTKI